MFSRSLSALRQTAFRVPPEMAFAEPARPWQRRSSLGARKTHPAREICALIASCCALPLFNNLQALNLAACRSLLLACVLTASMAAFAQDQMKQDDMKNDHVKQDDMKSDQMKHETMKKDQKSKKVAKKDAMKKVEMKNN
jgi:pentapeptide MXKDX repeat protein